jgi:hypothetical protein
MTGLGHEGAGPRCDNLPPAVKREGFVNLCRSLGIEPGTTWVLEISHEGVLQFTRPLTDAEKSTCLDSVDKERRPFRSKRLTRERKAL